MHKGTVFISKETKEKYEKNKDTKGFYDRKSLSEINDGINIGNLNIDSLPEEAVISLEYELTFDTNIDIHHSGIIFVGATNLSKEFVGSIQFWSSRVEKLEENEDEIDESIYHFDNVFFPYFEGEDDLTPLNEEGRRYPDVLVEGTVIKLRREKFHECPLGTFVKFSLNRKKNDDELNLGCVGGDEGEEGNRDVFPVDEKEAEYKSVFFLSALDILTCPTDENGLIYIDAIVEDMFDYGYYY